MKNRQGNERKSGSHSERNELVLFPLGLDFSRGTVWKATLISLRQLLAVK